MAKFLNISYDKWHGILAFVVVFLLFALFWALWAAPLGHKLGAPIAFLLTFTLAFLAAHHLQSWYELRQAYNPDVNNIYGSWTQFILNSRRDFKYFYIGVFFAWWAAVFVFWITI
ncbi:MAG: hypothetical protein Kow0037_00790 [Calditrichia bacterium]